VLGHIANRIPHKAHVRPRSYDIHVNDIQTLDPPELPDPWFSQVQILSWENQTSILERPALLFREVSGRRGVALFPIVVLRDPSNWFASLRRRRRWKEWKQYKYAYIPLWIGYAKRFFVEGVSGVFACNYNKWFTSTTYRAELSGFLGEEHTDRGLNRVRSIGFSFDGRRYDYRAQDMKVLERWKHLSEQDLLFLKQYLELDELAGAIFDFSPV
jgi:hypothetical protein